MTIFVIPQIILLGLLSLATLYILVFAIAGRYYRRPSHSHGGMLRRFAILIPAYREDAVIGDAARSALGQRYPLTQFDVVVIADSLQHATLERLRQLPVKLVEVSFASSTKAKALNAGMASIGDDYDVALVLDADNIMEAGFLEKVNHAFNSGYIAVQGHRKAKNRNNHWAVLDAVSEEINNHIFRKGHRVLGLSSAIIGSGMAFDYRYFKSMMQKSNAVGGFDKEIELTLLKEGHRIEYLDDALVYDEKIQESGNFSNQRRRWLSVQIHYFRKGIVDATITLVTRGNVDHFNKALQFIQPPRILLLGMNFLAALVFVVLNWVLSVPAAISIAWVVLNVLTWIALVISIPRELFDRRLLHALRGLPRGMCLMLISLLRIRNANKKFIHTVHTTGGTPSH